MPYVDDHIHVGNHQSLHMLIFEHKILKNVKHWNKPSSDPYWKYLFYGVNVTERKNTIMTSDARYLIMGTIYLWYLLCTCYVNSKMIGQGLIYAYSSKTKVEDMLTTITASNWNVGNDTEKHARFGLKVRKLCSF